RSHSATPPGHGAPRSPQRQPPPWGRIARKAPPAGGKADGARGRKSGFRASSRSALFFSSVVFFISCAPSRNVLCDAISRLSRFVEPGIVGGGHAPGGGGRVQQAIPSTVPLALRAELEDPLLTSRSRSLPKKISSPTKKVGAPKVPRATERSVLARSSSLISRVWSSSRNRSASSPDSSSAARSTCGSSIFFGSAH